MARLMTLEADKTYATRENAIAAVNKFEQRLKNDAARAEFANLAYFIHQSADGRYFPVFTGDRALRMGMHFHFSVVA